MYYDHTSQVLINWALSICCSLFFMELCWLYDLNSTTHLWVQAFLFSKNQRLLKSETSTRERKVLHTAPELWNFLLLSCETGWLLNEYMYKYNGILFRLKKGNPVPRYKMDETWGRYAKWNKSSPKHKCYALKMVKMANFRLCLFSTIKLVCLNYFSQMTENWLWSKPACLSKEFIKLLSINYLQWSPKR